MIVRGGYDVGAWFISPNFIITAILLIIETNITIQVMILEIILSLMGKPLDVG